MRNKTGEHIKLKSKGAKEGLKGKCNMIAHIIKYPLEVCGYDFKVRTVSIIIFLELWF